MVETSRGSRSAGDRAARISAVVLAVFWGGFFFGLIDLTVVFAQDDAFYDSYLVETGWGLVYTCIVAVPFVALAVRPQTSPPVWQLLAAAGSLAAAALFSLDLPQLLPAAGIVLSAGAVVLLTGRRRIPTLPRERHGSMAGAIAWLLFAIAVAPWLAYAMDMTAAAREGRYPVDLTNGLDHWPVQAALAVAVVLVSALAVLVAEQWRVPAWSEAVSAGWLGATSWFYPNHAGSLGSFWGAAALAWGVLFLVVCEWNGRGVSG